MRFWPVRNAVLAGDAFELHLDAEFLGNQLGKLDVETLVLTVLVDEAPGKLIHLNPNDGRALCLDLFRRHSPCSVGKGSRRQNDRRKTGQEPGTRDGRC